MFCYKCGKECDLIDGLCPDCYREERTLVEMDETYIITICKSCDSYFYNTWKEFTTIEDIVEDIFRTAFGKKRARFVDTFGDSFTDSIQVRYSFEWGEDEVRVDATLCGYPDAFKELVIEEDHAFDIKIKYTVCKRCSKQFGGYYEAVLQIRRDGRHLTKEETESYVEEVGSLASREIEKNPMAFITQVLMKKEGVDFQLGSLKFAKKLARTLQQSHGGGYSESYRLTGFDRQAGKERYRTTIAFRLSRFEVGTILFYNSMLWKIVSDVGKLQLQNFESQLWLEVKKAEDDFAQGLLEIVDDRTMREGIVASASDDGAEIMLLDNYETLYIDSSRYGKGIPQGGSVLVSLRNDTHYALNP